VVFGTNAILVFFAAHLTSKMMGRLRWELADGTTTSLYSWIYKNLFASWAGPLNGSLAFAITYVLLWLVILIPLYRKRIFLKI
jgi:predicted acyltransferase